MKRFKITKDHGWTLREQKRKIKNTLLRQQVMTAHLVMEGVWAKR